MISMGSLTKQSSLLEAERHGRVFSLISWARAFFALGLRFFTRTFSRAGLWYDDFVLIPAFVSQ